MSNTNTIKTLVSVAIFIGLGISIHSMAKVSPEEAAQLGNQLNPMGGMRAGNIEGTIPAWTGGITKPPAGYNVGGNYVDPYGSDGIMFTITPENFSSVQAQLTEGHKALLKAYDSYMA